MTPANAASKENHDLTQLRLALETVLRSYFGEQVRVLQLSRRQSPYRTSFGLQEIDVICNGGMTLSLVLKDVGWMALHENAKGVKPRFLYDPLREIEAYTAVLAPRRMGTPMLYGVSVVPGDQRYWLFIERVPGPTLFEVGIDAWLQAARWLAGMHARFMCDTGANDLKRLSHLVRYDASYFEIWPERARSVLSTSGTEPARLILLDQLADRYYQVVDRLASLPTTFVHGEFFASNVLVQSDPTGLRVAPVDWEMAGVGPGVIDVAALISGDWTAAEATEIARAYYAALVEKASVDTGWTEFLENLSYCQIHVAMQWAGWSAGWLPPAAHARDWLVEALGSAQGLGLCAPK